MNENLPRCDTDVSTGADFFDSSTCRRRHVDVRSASRAGYSAAIRFCSHSTLARPPAAVEREIPRRLRIVRVADGPRPDEPPCRARAAPENLDAAEELRGRRLLRTDACGR